MVDPLHRGTIDDRDSSSVSPPLPRLQAPTRSWSARAWRPTWRRASLARSGRRRRRCPRRRPCAGDRVPRRVLRIGFGLKASVASREHDRPHDGRPLVERLTDEERRVYLPLVIRAPGDALGAVDVIWYVRGHLRSSRSRVDRDGRRCDPRPRPATRWGTTRPASSSSPPSAESCSRSSSSARPWLQAEIERQNWHVLKWQHLDTLSARAGARIEWLEPVLGLDPLIERGGEQLTMFGE